MFKVAFSRQKSHFTDVAPQYSNCGSAVAGPGTLEHPGLLPQVADQPRTTLSRFLESGFHVSGEPGAARGVLYPHGAGVDVHKDSVVAWVGHMCTAR
jgi:hypothetical protein